MLNEINLNCDENVWSACFFVFAVWSADEVVLYHHGDDQLKSSHVHCCHSLKGQMCIFGLKGQLRQMYTLRCVYRSLSVRLHMRKKCINPDIMQTTGCEKKEEPQYNLCSSAPQDLWRCFYVAFMSYSVRWSRYTQEPLMALINNYRLTEQKGGDHRVMRRSHDKLSQQLLFNIIYTFSS